MATLTIPASWVESGTKGPSGYYKVGDANGGAGAAYTLAFSFADVDFSDKIVTKIRVVGSRYVDGTATSRKCRFRWYSLDDWGWGVGFPTATGTHTVGANNGTKTWTIYDWDVEYDFGSYNDAVAELIEYNAPGSQIYLRLDGSGSDYTLWWARNYTSWSIAVDFIWIPASPVITVSWNKIGNNIPILGTHNPTVSWPAVPNATDYLISIYNKTTSNTVVYQQITETSYTADLSSYVSATSNQTFEFFVCSLNDGYGWKQSSTIDQTCYVLGCTPPAIETSATTSKNPLFLSSGVQVPFKAAQNIYSTLSTDIRFYFTAKSPFTGVFSLAPSGHGSSINTVYLDGDISGTNFTVSASFATGYISQILSPTNEVNYQTLRALVRVPYLSGSNTLYKDYIFEYNIDVRLKIDNPSGAIRQVQLKANNENLYPKTMTSMLVNCPPEWNSAATLERLIIDAFYPVGSILYTTDTVNPNSSIGGSWQKLQNGIVIVGAGSYTDANGETRSYSGNTFYNGNLQTIMTEAQTPAHQHTYGNKTVGYTSTQTEAGGGSQSTYPTSTTGGSQAQNTQQPYIVVNIYQRVS